MENIKEQNRTEDMRGTGVGHQALSQVPEPLSYWIGADDGTAMCWFLSETLAGVAATAAGAATFEVLANRAYARGERTVNFSVSMA